MNVTQSAVAAPDMSKAGQQTRARANREERMVLAHKVNGMYADLDVTVRVAPKGCSLMLLRILAAQVAKKHERFLRETFNGTAAWQAQVIA